MPVLDLRLAQGVLEFNLPWPQVDQLLPQFDRALIVLVRVGRHAGQFAMGADQIAEQLDAARLVCTLASRGLKEITVVPLRLKPPPLRCGNVALALVQSSPGC